MVEAGFSDRIGTSVSARKGLFVSHVIIKYSTFLPIAQTFRKNDLIRLWKLGLECCAPYFHEDSSQWRLFSYSICILRTTFCSTTFLLVKCYVKYFCFQKVVRDKIKIIMRISKETLGTT